MPIRVFDSVWYLPHENKWRDLNILAYRDIGKLTVSENSIEFHGSKETVVVTDIKRVAFGKQGRDFVNNWVKIEYGESTTSSVAFFADGSLLGWGGIFGGNEEHPGNGGTTLSSRRWASKAISDENRAISLKTLRKGLADASDLIQHRTATSSVGYLI